MIEELFAEYEAHRAESRRIARLIGVYGKILDNKRASRLEKTHAAVRLAHYQTTALQRRQEWDRLRAALLTDAPGF